LCVSRDGTVGVGKSKGTSILPKSTVNCALASIFDEIWTVEIWKTLPKIDGGVLEREATHRAEDRLAKWREALIGVWRVAVHRVGDWIVLTVRWTDVRLLCNDRAVPAPPIANANIECVDVYSDSDLVALNKPSGRVTLPGIGHRDDSLMNGLFARERAVLMRLGSDRDWGLLHRLDRESSGVILVARTAQAYDGIRQQFENRTIEKTYLAIVRGRLPASEGVCRQPLSEVRRGDMKVSVPAPRGEIAVTHWRTLASSPELALVACAIETGKLHQIRAHFAHLGAPIEGDRVYRSLLPPNTSAPPANQRHLAPTLRLHAWRIGLIHPINGQRLDIEAPIPANMLELLGECLGGPSLKQAPLTPVVQRITAPVRTAAWWMKSKSS